MAVYGFGSGSVLAYRTDISNPTPIQVGVLQSVEIDFSFDIKELNGQFQFPVDTARANGKITGKASTAKIDVLTYNELFFGQTVNTGQDIPVVNEAASVPAESPYTVEVENSATWTEDQGVYNAATGIKMKRVASGPTTGQYSVAAGTYTFATADEGIAVMISYTYTVTTGNSILITNKLLGETPTLKVTAANQYKGKNLSIELYACTPSKWSFPTKLNDYVMQDWEFSAYADASGNVGKISASE